MRVAHLSQSNTGAAVVPRRRSCSTALRFVFLPAISTPDPVLFLWLHAAWRWPSRAGGAVLPVLGMPRSCSDHDTATMDCTALQSSRQASAAAGCAARPLRKDRDVLHGGNLYVILRSTRAEGHQAVRLPCRAAGAFVPCAFAYWWCRWCWRMRSLCWAPEPCCSPHRRHRRHRASERGWCARQHAWWPASLSTRTRCCGVRAGRTPCTMPSVSPTRRWPATRRRPLTTSSRSKPPSCRPYAR